MYAMVLPTFGLLLLVGLLGAIHPYVSGVFTTLATALHGHGIAKRRVLLALACYILAQFAVFALISLLLLLFSTWVPVGILQIIQLVLGLYITAWAMVEARAWLYPQSFKSKLPPAALRWARKAIEQQPTAQNGIYIALLVGVAQMQLLTAPLLAFYSITHLQITSSGMLSVLLLSAIVVLPMVKILLFLSGSTKVSTVKNWQRRLAGPTRLVSAGILFLLGMLLLLTAGRFIYIG